MRWYVYGALAAVECSGEDGANDRVWCFLVYSSYDVQIGRNQKKHYCMFKVFQLAGFTFKFRLRITYQKIIMAFNFGVAIYIVGKLIFM